eukprot:SAG31_NODE_3240_length_4506_cov_2.792830_3_plen_502_part_00
MARYISLVKSGVHTRGRTHRSGRRGGHARSLSAGRYGRRGRVSQSEKEQVSTVLEDTLADPPKFSSEPLSAADIAAVRAAMKQQPGVWHPDLCACAESVHTKEEERYILIHTRILASGVQLLPDDSGRPVDITRGKEKRPIYVVNAVDDLKFGVGIDTNTESAAYRVRHCELFQYIRTCEIRPQIQAQLDLSPPLSCDRVDKQCCGELALCKINANPQRVSLASACSCALRFELPFDLRIQLTMEEAPATTITANEGTNSTDRSNENAVDAVRPYNFAERATKLTAEIFSVSRDSIRSNIPNPDGSLDGTASPEYVTRVDDESPVSIAEALGIQNVQDFVRLNKEWYPNLNRKAKFEPKTTLRLPAAVVPRPGCRAVMTVCGAALPASEGDADARLHSLADSLADAMKTEQNTCEHWQVSIQVLRCGAYHAERLAMVASQTVVHECHEGCACFAPGGEPCGNRVVQSGIRDDVILVRASAANQCHYKPFVAISLIVLSLIF